MNHRLAHCRLYGFIDTAYLEGRDPQELTRGLIAGGVDILQVRAKRETHDQRVALGRAVLNEAQPHQVPVIINDDLDAARELGADGVHLGQEDWARLGGSTERADRLAGLGIVGLSTHSLDQARQAERDGVDYIGVGPVFPTATKPGVTPVGLELLRQAAAHVHVPFFAIGGITLDNLAAVRQAGASRVAVVSAILCAKEVLVAARKFRDELNQDNL